jgi:ribosomal protein L32E
VTKISQKRKKMQFTKYKNMKYKNTAYHKKRHPAVKAIEMRMKITSAATNPPLSLPSASRTRALIYTWNKASKRDKKC